MSLSLQPMIEELQREIPVTQRVLEAMPEDQLNFQPGEKAMPLGQLAMHIAGSPRAIVEMADRDQMDVADMKPTDAENITKAEILKTWQVSSAGAIELLSQHDDAWAAKTWQLVRGPQQMMTMPKGMVIRNILLNHLYHHRGQLCTYYRCMGVAVPAVFGNSADENPFA